ncbi:MAG TPA: response regulator transcription factor [Pyrinomonadaceae bacterium]|nr:response regulator transcription factor [Pyrinomonadaceae bacterium]
MRVLLVEDEPNAARMLAKGLREHGYAVDVASDGEEALYQESINEYDLIVLDVMLPRKDGFEVCQTIRDAGSAIPILMLTARDAVDDRISGLDSGADDYLTKPFDFGELLARLRALLRRPDGLLPESITIADLVINVRARRVRRADEIIQLTSKEYTLLEYFARNADRVLSRGEIAEHVWDQTFDLFSNSIEVYIQRLRRKIDDGHSRKFIQTRRGEGYVFVANEES